MLEGRDPNLGTCQEVLYSLIDVKRFAGTKEVMCRMIQKGVNPCSVSYKLVMHGFCGENI